MVFCVSQIGRNCGNCDSASSGGSGDSGGNHSGRLKAIQSGITLVELMIALVVISILFMVAVPTYQYGIIKVNRESVRAELIAVAEKLSALSLQSSDGRLPTGLKLDADKLLKQDSQYYDFDIELVDSGYGYWIVALPKESEMQSGDGAQALGHTGVGCWYKGNDAPAVNEPCDLNRYATW